MMNHRSAVLEVNILSVVLLMDNRLWLLDSSIRPDGEQWDSSTDQSPDMCSSSCWTGSAGSGLYFDPLIHHQWMASGHADAAK